MPPYERLKSLAYAVLLLLGIACSELFEYLPDLIQTPWYVETTFPLAAFQRKQNFTATVEIAVPLGIFMIFKACPKVFVQT